MTSLRMNKVCCLCSAPPEKSMQLQGWGHRSPLWDLGRVNQSPSASIFPSLLPSLFIYVRVHQRLQNHLPLTCYNLPLLKFFLLLYARTETFHSLRICLVRADLFLLYRDACLTPAPTAPNIAGRIRNRTFQNRKWKVMCLVSHEVNGEECRSQAEVSASGFHSRTEDWWSVSVLYLMGSWSSLFSLLWMIFIPLFLARGHPERLQINGRVAKLKLTDRYHTEGEGDLFKAYVSCDLETYLLCEA